MILRFKRFQGLSFSANSKTWHRKAAAKWVFKSFLRFDLCPESEYLKNKVSKETNLACLLAERNCRIWWRKFEAVDHTAQAVINFTNILRPSFATLTPQKITKPNWNWRKALRNNFVHENCLYVKCWWN